MNSVIRPLSFAFTLFASQLSFADTLADIYELALKNDATLKTAEATYRANIESENQAFSALLPQINAYASHSESDIDSDGSSSFGGTVIPTSSTNRDAETDSWSISLNQNLFDLPVWFSFQQGKELTKQAEAQLAFDQQDLIVRVAEAYFNVLRSIDNLEAAKAEERATKRQLEQTQQRFDVGLIAITDVHEARAVYDSTVVQRLTDEGNLGTSYESLMVLTGQPHANLWLLSKDFPVADPDPISRDEWVQFALKNNNALKASIFAMQAAQENASSKKMGHAPTLTASIAYSDTDTEGDLEDLTTSTSNPFDSQSDGTTWSIDFKLPIFSGGRVSAQRRQAYEQYNAAMENKIQTQRTVIRNARAQHITVVTDVQRVKARQQAIVSTSSALDATQAGYEVGTRNIVDVLQAQRALYSSIRDYANSRYDYVINMLKLKRAAGTLTPQDIYAINQWMVEPGAPTANQYQDYLNR